MKPMEMLLGAKTEAEFFVIICHLFSEDLRGHRAMKLTATGALKTGNGHLELVLRLSTPKQDGKITHYSNEVTHIFSLTQTGELTWWLKDQPLITGLKNVQAKLEQMNQSPEQFFLP